MRFWSCIPLFILLQYSVCGQKAPTPPPPVEEAETGIISAIVTDGDENPIDGVTIWINGEAMGDAGDAIELPIDVDLVVVPEKEGWAFCPSTIVVVLEQGDELDLDFLSEQLMLKGVVVEDFTNTACLGCPEADEALWAAVGELAVDAPINPISWHGRFPNPGDPF